MNRLITMTAILVTTLATGACLDESTPAPPPVPVPADFARQVADAIHAECGEMPWPEPGFTVTQSGGRSCMPDAEYLARDLHQQAVERWGVCVEIAICRLRGQCGR